MTTAKPLSHPHIPNGKVCFCAIGAGHPYIKEALENLGIEVLELAPSPLLSKPVATHADMLLHHMGEGRVLLAQNDENAKYCLEQKGFQVTVLETPLGKAYPKDAALNSFVLGKYLFGSNQVIAEELLNYYQYQGRELVEVRQGYTKCSTCILNEHTIITSDRGIEKTAKQTNIDALLIQPGFIKLPGYHYGFIGGASSLLNFKDLYFCGDLETHVDVRIIKNFCESHEITIKSLVSGPLLDIGGIISLSEKL